MTVCGICFSRPARFHRGSNSTTRTKDAFYNRRFRPRRAYHVLQHPVHDVFLEDAEIAIFLQIFFQRFQLQAQLIRDVAHLEHAEIRKPGLGTHRSEFRNIDDNFVIGELVGPGIDFGKAVVQPSFGVVFGVAGAIRHHGYCSNHARPTFPEPSIGIEHPIEGFARTCSKVPCLVPLPGKTAVWHAG
jgi:hypothetical protein